jgi:hypothetical protein
LKQSVGVAGEVALEEAGRFAASLAFGDASFDVRLRGGIVLTSLQDDRLQGAVELPVAAAAESVPDGLAAGGRDRATPASRAKPLLSGRRDATRRP